MLKKTIEYTDFNGVKRSEDYYFNLMKSEVIEMQFKSGGGLFALVEKITKERDLPKLYDLFTELIKMSYGEKDLDGKRHRKSKELTDAFLQTEAYSQLLLELLSDGGKPATEFFNAIIPEFTREELIALGVPEEEAPEPKKPQDHLSKTETN